MPLQSDNQPTIVKYVGANYGGIQLLALSRYAIGYVMPVSYTHLTLPTIQGSGCCRCGG